MFTTCPLNQGGVSIHGGVSPGGVRVAALPLRSPPRRTSLRITQGDQRCCSPAVKHGEDNDGEDQAVHGPEARHERSEEEGDGVPAEPALCGELHPEHYLRHRARRAPGCHSGGGRGRQVFHERRHSADRPDRCRQRGGFVETQPSTLKCPDCLSLCSVKC